MSLPPPTTPFKLDVIGFGFMESAFGDNIGLAPTEDDATTDHDGESATAADDEKLKFSTRVFARVKLLTVFCPRLLAANAAPLLASAASDTARGRPPATERRLPKRHTDQNAI